MSDTSEIKYPVQKSLQFLWQFIQEMEEELRCKEVNLLNYAEHFQFKVPTQTLSVDLIERIVIEGRIINTSAAQHKKNWTDEEFMVLVWVVIKVAQKEGLDLLNLSDDNWSSISSIIRFKSKELCQFKWLSNLRTNIQDRPWSEEEDQMLYQLMIEKGVTFKWNEVAKEIYKKSGGKYYRKGKQFRERWNNYLNPTMKRGSWNDEEDILLVELSLEHGLKWSSIAKKMKFRTENAVKNRFKSLIAKEKKLIQKVSNNDINTVAVTQSVEVDNWNETQELAARVINKLKNRLPHRMVAMPEFPQPLPSMVEVNPNVTLMQLQQLQIQQTLQQQMLYNQQLLQQQYSYFQSLQNIHKNSSDDEESTQKKKQQNLIAINEIILNQRFRQSMDSSIVFTPSDEVKEERSPQSSIFSGSEPRKIRRVQNLISQSMEGMRNKLDNLLIECEKHEQNN